MATMRRAIEIGVQMLEFDVRITKDNQVGGGGESACCISRSHNGAAMRGSIYRNENQRFRLQGSTQAVEISTDSLRCE